MAKASFKCFGRISIGSTIISVFHWSSGWVQYARLSLTPPVLFYSNPNNPDSLIGYSVVCFSWLVVFNAPSTARSFRDGTPLTVPYERCEAQFSHCSHWESNPGSSCGSPLHYRCTTPAPASDEHQSLHNLFTKMTSKPISHKYLESYRDGTLGKSLLQETKEAWSVTGLYRNWTHTVCMQVQYKMAFATAALLWTFRCQKKLLTWYVWFTRSLV